MHSSFPIDNNSSNIENGVMTANLSLNSDPCEICPVSGETAREDRFNYLTHLIGLFLSLVGGAVLFWESLSGDIWNVVSCTAYIVTLIGLYTASTFYHRCRHAYRKKAWKIADHACIYLLIAGSSTPFTLGPLRDSFGWHIFFVVWGIAALGIIFKLVAIDRFKRLSLCSYLLLGWLIAFCFPALAEVLSLSSLIWLIAGGVAYTLGTLFYAWESLPFSHAIWHLFVLTGSSCHYFSILGLVQSYAIP